MGNRKHILVDYEVYDMVMIECKKEFLEHHPEFVGMKITHNFIIRKLAEHYLRS